jgi:hypothetical protein
MIRMSSLIGSVFILVMTISAVLIDSTCARAYPTLTPQQQRFIRQQRQTELFMRGARPSYMWRKYGKVRRLITYQTPIQHVVVIDMENRTVDNLFSAYYNAQWKNTNLTWHQVMDLYNPNSPAPMPTLTPVPLGTPWDPHHRHDDFNIETLSNFETESYSCHGPCPSTVTAFGSVPMSDTPQYAQIVQNYESADEVFQSNQGPSMPAHQYLIAGQSGGIPGPHSSNAPFAVTSNPTSLPQPLATGDDNEGGDPDGGNGIAPYCQSNQTRVAPSIDMTLAWPRYTKNFPTIGPCETYTKGTILDEIVVSQGLPTDWDWQYISRQEGGYWAAPTAVQSLYNQWFQDRFGINEPFAVDQNAYHFVQNLNMPNAPRPFAALTYITPCPNASDHADSTGNNTKGPLWVGALINDIATAQGGKYWPSTAIIVTWDDWGGWFDHVNWQESANNFYPFGNGNPPNPFDPNEWGYRVPVLVISPYSFAAGYVSHTPRSQGAILNLIESLFTLDSLSADDAANGSDNMRDMFTFGNVQNFQRINVGSYTIPQGC